MKRLSAYAKTSEHAGDPRSLTMGLAIATSGAAASPNMGYHSSPTLGFLMTVFNVRLGWWLRNPRFREVWTDQKTGVSLRELLYELLGMTTDDRKWVYLSDGGHFENLGVYELVRRRCRLIIACDAGQDGDVTFEDLGNAIERCRADFGVDIEIDLGKLRPGPDRRSEWHCAIGTIRYDRLPPIKEDDPTEVPGTLLYIKSSLTGDEPADILRYAAEHPAFPHESTDDQFFDESQFESYRALGFHAAAGRVHPRAARRRSAPASSRWRSSRCCGSAGASRRRRRPTRCGSIRRRSTRIWTVAAQRRRRSSSSTGRCFPRCRRSWACRRKRCRAACRRLGAAARRELLAADERSSSGARASTSACRCCS